MGSRSVCITKVYLMNERQGELATSIYNCSWHPSPIGLKYQSTRTSSMAILTTKNDYSTCKIVYLSL